MKRLCMLTVFLCLLLNGCTVEGPEPENTPPASATPAPTADPAPPEPREGGTLNLSMRAPVTLNPLLNEDVTVDRILKLVFEPLAMLDAQLKPVDHLASLNFSSDYTSVTLTLREDAIWSDSMPVSADDFIFSVETLRNAPDGAIYKHCVDNIASCEKINAKTVKISFVEVFGGSAYMFNFPVIPQHYYKNEKNPSSTKNMTPLGNGLFLFDAYEPLTSISLSQSPYTFRQRAYIEDIDVLFIPDTETELNAFDQGLIDAIPLEITEWSRHHSVKQTRYGEFPATYYDFIGFNFDVDILNNLLFRQAVAHSFDADEVIASVYLSHALRTLTPVNPASWLYEASTTAYAYDVGKAEILLERVRRGEAIYTPEEDDETIDAFADWSEGTAVDGTEADGTEESGSEANNADPDNISTNENGETDADGNSEGTESSHIVEIPPLRVMVNLENDERVKMANALADGMRALGLEVALEVLPFETFVERLNERDFDIFVGGYNLSVIPDLHFAFSIAGIADGTNLLSYSDPTLDRYMNAAFSAYAENEFRRALSNVQRHIAEQLPVISLAFRQSAVLTDTRVNGEIRPSVDNVFANINEWFIVDAP